MRVSLMGIVCKTLDVDPMEWRGMSERAIAETLETMARADWPDADFWEEDLRAAAEDIMNSVLELNE